MSVTIDVDTRDLRQALTAVLPHAGTDENVQDHHRVYFLPAPDQMLVCATNGWSAGMATVSVYDQDGLTADAETDAFTLMPGTARELLGLFPASSQRDENDMGGALRFTITGEDLVVLDVSGLWPGKELKLPGTNSYETVLNLPLTFLRAVAAPRALPGRVPTNGKLLKAFTSAAAAYGKPLVIEPTGRTTSILIRCGASFLGLLTPTRFDDYEQTEHDTWADAWPDRLDGPARGLRQPQKDGAAA
ncbi:hypothetical protein [Tersicoccus sp. Bi-70]|uniref:hypothetical protein n=1 Tax=Tersicoccus sp. Bi-70 TaxID=1897634 RepID=UPI000975A8DE|nr:hypothetical protein [Tersicoccus sp. Bi-70]OMH30631.1 hypothetical protein BGP79_11775 [Tersicoccus sp. Bi-70]